MANNASGSRSVAYGGTKDHVLAVDVVLHGGEIFKAGPVGRQSPELATFLDGSSVAARAYSRILPLLEEKQAAIAASMPRVMKNASGYRVETILDGDNVNLHKIFVSSEGTLGLITEATLNLVPLPGRRAIAMAYFPTVFAAGEAVFPILGLKPTSLEIMDSSFLNFVRKSKPTIDAMLPANVNTALLVEFEAADDAELAERLAALETLLAGGPGARSEARAGGGRAGATMGHPKGRRPAPPEAARPQADRRVHRRRHRPSGSAGGLHEHPRGHPAIPRRGGHHVRPCR